MKNKMQLLFIFVLTLLTLVGCNNEVQNPSNTQISGENVNNPSSEEVSDSVYFTFDAYGEANGILAVTELSIEGSTKVSESVSWGFEAIENEKILDVLNRSGVVAINPMLEDNIFEGWMIFKEEITVDEDGFENFNYEKISEDKLYSTNEIFEMSIPNYNVIYVAKWSTIPMEDYYKEDYSTKPIMDTTYFSFYANGGTITFSDVENESFELERYDYWLNENESLKDVMNGDIINSAILKSVQKEGATFTGWTVYEADNLNWSSAEVIEDGTKNFLYNPNDEDFKYMYLENCVLYSENASTEELLDITYNGKHHYAVANWE